MPCAKLENRARKKIFRAEKKVDLRINFRRFFDENLSKIEISAEILCRRAEKRRELKTEKDADRAFRLMSASFKIIAIFEREVYAAFGSSSAAPAG
jgi:hypothetical protein